MVDGHVEYFVLLARILELAGISAAEADKHLWQAGTWPAPAAMWSTEAMELRRQLSQRVIELVELWWLDRDKPPELDAALRDLRGMHPEPSYSADDIAALTGLDDIKPRPQGHVAVQPLELSDEDVAEIEAEARADRRATLEIEFLETLRARQDWETEEEWRARIKLWGL